MVMGRDITSPVPSVVAVYIINRAYLHRFPDVSSFAGGRRIVESMLPESNRLSGNRHDAEERSRLRGQNLFGN